MVNLVEQTAVERLLLVRVGIPHFSRISHDDAHGYGSFRADAAIFCAVALSRCLGGVLSLARAGDEEVLESLRQTF